MNAAVLGRAMNNNPSKTRRFAAASTATEPPLTRDHAATFGVPGCTNPFKKLAHQQLHPRWLAVPGFGLVLEMVAMVPTPEQLDRMLNMIVRENAFLGQRYINKFIICQVSYR